MKVFKKILSILGDVIVAAILVLSIMIVISTVANKKKGVPSAFGVVTSIVLTNSMEPTLMVDDYIVGVMQKDDYEYKVGDVISFKGVLNKQEVIFTHRIVEVTEEGYKTRGDNSELYYCYDGDGNVLKDENGDPILKVDDETLTRDKIVCLYKFSIPQFGKVINFLKEPLGFILCIMLPMLIFIGVQIYRIIDIYLKSKKEEMLKEAQTQTSEDVKDAIIREYLEKQKALENNVENKNE